MQKEYVIIINGINGLKTKNLILNDNEITNLKSKLNSLNLQANDKSDRYMIIDNETKLGVL